MEGLINILEKQGLSGVVIFAMGYVMWKYVFPAFQSIANTNLEQAKTLEKVNEGLTKISSDLPTQIEAVKDEIIDAIKENSQNRA